MLDYRIVLRLLSIEDFSHTVDHPSEKTMMASRKYLYLLVYCMVKTRIAISDSHENIP